MLGKLLVNLFALFTIVSLLCMLHPVLAVLALIGGVSAFV